MQPIRILFVGRVRSPAAVRRVALLAREGDLDITLVHPRWWRDEYGGRRIEIPAAGFRTVPVPMIGRSNDPHRALYATLTFAMLTVRPHIVHAEEEPDSLAALQVAAVRRLLAPRARLVLHTWQNVARRLKPHVRAVIRRTLNAADTIICSNSEAVTLLARLGFAGPTALIPASGVDRALFRPLAARGPGEPFTVAYVGRLAPEKGIDVLLEAISMVDAPVAALLVGDGPSRAALLERARELGVGGRVEFRGPLPAERIPEVLGQADALVLPSRTTPVWKEQLGRVLLEAMASGVPVVGSSSGAIPEVVGDAGMVFPEGDAVALAACLSRLAASPELRARLAARGLERAATLYDEELLARRTADFYRALAGRDSTPR